MKNTYIELNQAFVDEVGREKARAFASGLERAFRRLDANDHDRALELVEEEARNAGVRLAPPEAGTFADQIVRFDDLTVFLPDETPPVSEDPLARSEEPADPDRIR